MSPEITIFIAKAATDKRVWIAVIATVCALLFCLASCSAFSISSLVAFSTYPSEPDDLLAVEAAYSELETQHIESLKNSEQTKPGYDEYQYITDAAGHDAHVLASYLSVVVGKYNIGMQKTKLATLMEHIQDDRIRNYVAPATCADQRTSLNIFSSALADLLKFVDAEMEQLLTGYSEELSAEKFINQPTIVYVICPDENPTRHFLASLFIRLFSNELIEFAEQPSNGGVLPRQVLYLADEFGNYPPIRDIEALFSALRSRRARLLISLQGDSQLRTKYDEQRAITIESNCMIFMFSALAPSASQTAKRISEILGNETIMTGSKSISKGVTTTNTSLAGRPLLTPSQLVRLPWGQFIVQKTGYAPYIAHMRPYKDYLKLEAEQQVPPPSLRYSSVLSASAAMIEAVAKGHLYHLRKGMFDSEDSDW